MNSTPNKEYRKTYNLDKPKMLEWWDSCRKSKENKRYVKPKYIEDEDKIEMEKRLIGKLMSKPSEYYDLHGMLSEEIFNDSLNKKLYKSISSILNDGGKLDMIGVIRVLRATMLVLD